MLAVTITGFASVKQLRQSPRLSCSASNRSYIGLWLLWIPFTHKPYLATERAEIPFLNPCSPWMTWRFTSEPTTPTRVASGWRIWDSQRLLTSPTVSHYFTNEFYLILDTSLGNWRHIYLFTPLFTVLNTCLRNHHQEIRVFQTKPNLWLNWWFLS